MTNAPSPLAMAAAREIVNEYVWHKHNERESLAWTIARIIERHTQIDRLATLLADEAPCWFNGSIGLRGGHSHDPFSCQAPDNYCAFCKHYLTGECTNTRSESEIALRNELRQELRATLAGTAPEAAQ